VSKKVLPEKRVVAVRDRKQSHMKLGGRKVGGGDGFIVLVKPEGGKPLSPPSPGNVGARRERLAGSFVLGGP